MDVLERLRAMTVRWGERYWGSETHGVLCDALAEIERLRDEIERRNEHERAKWANAVAVFGITPPKDG